MIGHRRSLEQLIRTMGPFLFVLALAVTLGKLRVGAEENELGSLRLQIIAAESGEGTPARVELLGKNGEGFVAEDALLVGGDPKDRETPWKGTLEDALAQLVSQIKHPYTRKVQFYSTGNSRLLLPPGSYKLRVMKGPEYEVQSRDLEIRPGDRVEETIEMAKWIDMSEDGWYSADSHLHIARSQKELDPYLSKWMQAEDVRVASLLQWGHSKRFHNTIQYSFGPESVYREGDFILASGQENPRTHMLGHTIILGASVPIHFPDRYVIYRLFWEEALRQGALNGYAHFGVAAGALNGLSVDLPFNLIHFLEVLQFGKGDYNVWYNILNTGFRMTPTAGSDYPFGGLPGIERFYTKVAGPLTYEAWLEGIRLGKTFVTNGPLIEFRVDGEEAGAELLLAKPGSVELEGSVRFDPTRDDVKRLDIIENGRVFQSMGREEKASQIRCRVKVEVRESGWLAVRASGNKLGEMSRIASVAHSGPVYLTVKDAPDRSAHPRAKVMARAWAARLEELERRLISQFDSMGLSRWSDGVDGEYLRQNREELTKAVQIAKQHFLEQAD